MKLRFKIKDEKLSKEDIDKYRKWQLRVAKNATENVPKNEGAYESADNKEVNKNSLYATENPSPTGPYTGSGGGKNERGYLVGDVPPGEPLWNTPKSDKKISKQEQELRELYLYKPVDANVKSVQPDFSVLKSIIGDNYDEIKLDEDYKDLEYKPYNEKKDGYFWENNKVEAKPKMLKASTGNTMKSIITNLKELDSQGEDLEEMSYRDYYKLINNGKEPPKQAYIFRVLGNTINKLKEGTVSKEIINYDANKHDCSDILSLAEYLANILIDLNEQKEA